MSHCIVNHGIKPDLWTSVLAPEGIRSMLFIA